MNDHFVCFLNLCSRRVRHDQIDRGDSPTLTSIAPKYPNRMKVQSFRSFEGATYVLRVSTGRERDEDISRCSKSEHLPRKDFIEGIVVGRRSQHRPVGRQADSRKRAPIIDEPARDFGGQMRAIRRAAAVTAS